LQRKLLMSQYFSALHATLFLPKTFNWSKIVQMTI
jgi:hypothetical protein